MALGLAAAVGASVLYNAGVALQAMEARHTSSTEGLRPSLLASLVRRRRWLVGLALGILGWPLQVAALVLAPLTLVQPALGVGLILLLPIGAHVLGEPVRARDLAGVLSLLAGVAVLAATVPSTEGAHAGPGRTTVALGVLAVVALAPYLSRAARLSDRRLVAVAAGAGFAWSGISTKLFSDAVSVHHVMVGVAWAAATGIASGIALLSESTALQQQPVTQVAPIVFGAQVLIPVAAAPLLVGEVWSGTPLRSTGVVLGLVTVLAGVTVLSRSKSIAGLSTPP